MSMVTVTTGSTRTIRAVITDEKGKLKDAIGALSLLVIAPNGGEATYKAGEITHDGLGEYHYTLLVSESGLWHYRWLDEAEVAGEGSFMAESGFDAELVEPEGPDLTDLKVLVPRARRKCEGPWGNPNNRPPLSDGEMYAMVADAVSEIIMLGGKAFHHELLVKMRDPLGGFPTAWHTDSILDEYEGAIICAQVGLDYYVHLSRILKTQEAIKNEGTEWTYTISAGMLREYLKQLISERDKAVNGLRINRPVLDRFASNIRVRDQATVAPLEWWAGYYDSGIAGGLPGGQESAVVPVFYPPGIGGSGGF